MSKISPFKINLSRVKSNKTLLIVRFHGNLGSCQKIKKMILKWDFLIFFLKAQVISTYLERKILLIEFQTDSTFFFLLLSGRGGGNKQNIVNSICNCNNSWS